MLKLVCQVIYLQHSLIPGKTRTRTLHKCSRGKGRKLEIVRRGCQNTVWNIVKCSCTNVCVGQKYGRFLISHRTALQGSPGIIWYLFYMWSIGSTDTAAKGVMPFLLTEIQLKTASGTSLVVQRSIHWATTAGGLGSTPGQGTNMTHAVWRAACPPIPPPPASKNGYRIPGIVIQSCSCGWKCWWEWKYFFLQLPI